MPALKSLRNGDVVATRLVKHKDGKASIKRTVVAKGVPSLPAISIQRAPDPVPANVAKTKSAARNAKKLAKETRPKLATPPTFKERTHVDNVVEQSAYVTTTNGVPKLLRRIKARTGSHVEQFQRDYELAGADLRSPNLETGGIGGSGGVPFPLAKVQAIDRLIGFQETNIVAFRMCEAVLIHNETPATIHAKGGPQHVVVSHMIREAVEDLANFYSPKRIRPDRTLALLTKIVEEARREAEGRT